MFYLERSLGSIRGAHLLWRLFAAAGAMPIVMALTWALHPILALIAGPIVYLGALVVLKAIGPEEKRMLERLRGGGESANQRVSESVSTI
jgi:hypothetical protein